MKEGYTMKGSYCLIIKVKKGEEIGIGKLGLIHFKPGYYVYVGSAMNGLEKRINRHIRQNKKLFWHIDYLLANKNVEIVDVKKRESDFKEECKIASRMNDKWIKGFGSSDCKCESHLFYFSKLDKAEKAVERALK